MKTVTLAGRAPVLPPSVADRVTAGVGRVVAGELPLSAALDRRLTRALAPHAVAIALSLARTGIVEPGGVVRLVVPRNFRFLDAHLDPSVSEVSIAFDPRTGRWMSDVAAGAGGIPGLCEHVWRIAGRQPGGRMAEHDLLALIGAAYLEQLAEETPR